MEELGFEPKAYSHLIISLCLLTCFFFIPYEVNGFLINHEFQVCI